MIWISRNYFLHNSARFLLLFTLYHTICSDCGDRSDVNEFVCGSYDVCFCSEVLLGISHVRMESVSDVLETLSELPDANFILTWLITRKYIISYSCHESFKLCIYLCFTLLKIITCEAFNENILQNVIKFNKYVKNLNEKQ